MARAIVSLKKVLADNQTVYAALRLSRIQYHQAELNLTAALNDLQVAKDAATLKGLSGSNDAARKAELNTICADQLATVQKAETARDEARLNLALAEDDEKAHRVTVRILEVSASIRRDNPDRH